MIEKPQRILLSVYIIVELGTIALLYHLCAQLCPKIVLSPLGFEISASTVVTLGFYLLIGLMWLTLGITVYYAKLLAFHNKKQA